MKAFNLSPAVDLVSRLSSRIGRLEASAFPWQRKDAALLREARDHLLTVISHVRLSASEEEAS